MHERLEKEKKINNRKVKKVYSCFVYSSVIYSAGCDFVYNTKTQEES